MPVAAATIALLVPSRDVPLPPRRAPEATAPESASHAPKTGAAGAFLARTLPADVSQPPSPFAAAKHGVRAGTLLSRLTYGPPRGFARRNADANEFQWKVTLASTPAVKSEPTSPSSGVSKLASAVAEELQLDPASLSRASDRGGRVKFGVQVVEPSHMDAALGRHVLSAVDLYESLTTDRPYRKAYNSADALTLMGGMVGGAVDRQVFEALTRTVRPTP